MRLSCPKCKKWAKRIDRKYFCPICHKEVRAMTKRNPTRLKRVLVSVKGHKRHAKVLRKRK